jgi:serine/threonine-protein kinase
LLGANLVLEGSLQQSSGTVRILYHVIDTQSLHQLHSGVITADATDIFALQDRVIDEVLATLDIELAQEDRGAVKIHGTAMPAAYDAWLRGRGYLQEYDRPDDLQNAIGEFLRSLQADPQFALAYAGLGQAYLHRYDATHSPESIQAASTACGRAANLNPKFPDGELCLGMLASATGQFGSAAQHLQHALQLDPSREEIYRELAIAYEGSKRSSDAEQVLKKEIDLRPKSWSSYSALGWFYAQHARYQNAVEQFKRVIELAPESVSGYSNLGATYIQQGKYSDAIDVLERSIQIQPTAAALNNLGAAYFYQRRYADSARVYELAAQITPDDYTVFGNLGEAYAEIEGKRDQSRASYAQGLKLAQQRLQASPQDSDALLSSALYAAGLGKTREAERYRLAAIKAAPNTAETRFISAQVLARTQQDGAALSELARSLKMGLPYSEVRDDPEWQRFSADPGYQALMHEYGKK